MICKLLGEIDGRVARIKQNVVNQNKEHFQHPDQVRDEWTMLTWNVLCITSRLQSNSSQVS